LSAFGANNLAFAIEIGAKDDTDSTLRGTLRRVRKYAGLMSKPITIPLKIGHGGLKLLRDINLGLAPLVRGLDHIIERGTGLEVVRKSFESLTGKSGRQADVLGRRMVQAASGTLRLSRAMQIANRAMASGISFKQLLVAMDFVSKKAITTGMSAEQAIAKVITGLSRGSTLLLDDFGILVDGVDGVRRAYESIHGKGVFDALGPAAQKAVIVEQAIAEMGGQMGRMGVTGKETVFVFQAIKNSIGDAVDKLFAAVGRSDALKSALQGIRDTIAGMIKHFESGGSLTDILFGKKDGKSGGLFGILKAGALDIGEGLGRGILGGLLKGISKLPELFDLAWDGLKSAWSWAMKEIPPALREGLRFLVDEFLPALKITAIQTALAIRDLLKGGIEGLAGLVVPGKMKQYYRSFQGTGRADPIAEAILWHNMMQQVMVGAIWDSLRGSTPAGGGKPSAAGVRPAGGSPAAGSSAGTGAPTSPLLGTLLSVAMAATGATLTHKPTSLFQLFEESADKLLGGGIFAGKSRVRTEGGKFLKDFPPPADAQTKPMPSFLDESRFPWGRRKMLEMKQRIRRIGHEVNLLDASDHQLKVEAAKQARDTVRRLRGQGLYVGRDDIAEIRAGILDKLMAERERNRSGLYEERDSIRMDLSRSEQRRQAGPHARVYGEGGAANEAAAARAEAQAKAAERSAAAIEELKAIGQQLYAAMSEVAAELTGAKNRLSAVGRRRH